MVRGAIGDRPGAAARACKQANGGQWSRSTCGRDPLGVRVARGPGVRAGSGVAMDRVPEGARSSALARGGSAEGGNPAGKSPHTRRPPDRARECARASSPPNTVVPATFSISNFFHVLFLFKLNEIKLFLIINLIQYYFSVLHVFSLLYYIVFVLYFRY